MPVDNQKVKEFEDKYKKVLFEQVGKVCSKQTELLTQIEKMGEFIDLESDLPNIGITLNNKIIELQHQFEKAGVSIYSQKIEDYGLFKINAVTPSFIGQAIIYDLIEDASMGIQKLGDYNKKMEELTKKRMKKVQSLEKTTPIKRFFARIKSFFIPVKQESFEYTKEETDEVNSHLLEFKEIDNQLWQYNLRDNVISSIVKHIRNQKYSADVIPGLVEDCVYPDLQKLGLGDLIPQLQQALIEKYKKDLPDNEVEQMKQEELDLYVPNFNADLQETREVDWKELDNIQENYGKLVEDEEIEL